MHLLVYGPGRLGSAIAGAAIVAGWPAPSLVGPGDSRQADRSPADGSRSGATRRPDASRADVVIDASRGESVLANLEHALAAGNRAFILAATGWDPDAARVVDRLLGAGAAAVMAPNLSLGAALFLRLAETAAGWYATAGAFEPSIVEWHRSGKADRPSGTARAIARRIAAADPRWASPDVNPGDHVDRSDHPDPGDPRPRLEVFGVRAGAAPGTHLVTFDGPGESIELRLTARDRSAYADGALAAARWLLADPREPGLHPFDAVVDDLLESPRIAVRS